MTWHMVYSTFIVSFSGGKPTKKLSNIWSFLATFVLVQLSAPCDQLDHELISIYLIDYNHMNTFDNAGNIAPNHVSIWYIQFAYNITLYLTVLCIAGQPPLLTKIWGLEQSLKSLRLRKMLPLVTFGQLSLPLVTFPYLWLHKKIIHIINNVFQIHDFIPTFSSLQDCISKWFCSPWVNK